jgi:hypothetical protein
VGGEGGLVRWTEPRSTCTAICGLSRRARCAVWRVLEPYLASLVASIDGPALGGLFRVGWPYAGKFRLFGCAMPHPGALICLRLVDIGLSKVSFGSQPFAGSSPVAITDSTRSNGLCCD